MLRRTPMTQSTTPLERRTPLVPRKPMPRSAKRRAAMKTQPRPRNTGPTPATRRMVLDRAAGCCELCGVQLHDGSTFIAAHSVHHRQPRGMGGTSRSDANAVTVLLLLCGTGTTGCHGHVEANRTEALAYGWLVPQGHDPAAAAVHVQHAGNLTPVLLTEDGTYELQEAA